MKKLIVYHGASPEYLEGFPKECKRSRQGAIHLLPGKPVTVTDDEYDHLVSKYPKVKAKTRMIAQIAGEEQPSE